MLCIICDEYTTDLWVVYGHRPPCAHHGGDVLRWAVCPKHLEEVAEAKMLEHPECSGGLGNVEPWPWHTDPFPGQSSGFDGRR